MVYNGTTQTVKGTTYYNLTSSAGTSATLGAATTVNNNLSVTSGIFADGGFQITGNGTGTLNVANGATLQIGAGAANTETFPTLFTTANISLGATSTVNYNSTSAMTVAGSVTSVGPSTYGHLTLSGNSVKTASAAITIAGNLTVNAGTFADGGNQITGNGSGTLQVAAGATLQIGAGTATITTFPTLFITTNITLGATSTVIYNSTGAMAVAGSVSSIGPATYGHLTLSGNSTKTAASAITVAGNLTINAGTFADGGNTITVNGNVTNNATHSGAGNIILTGGSGAHAISGTTSTFGTLILNDATYGGTMTGSGTTTIGTLTVTAGTLTLNAFTTSLSVTTTNVTGTLTFNNATGTRLMGAVTVNTGGIVNVTLAQSTPLITVSSLNINGGTWNNTVVNEPVTISTGTFTNTGTFNSGTGAYTFSAATSSINGNATTFSSLTVNSTTGTTNNIIASGGLTVITTLAGSGILIQAANANLNIGASTVTPTLTATATGNTVSYTGSGQTLKVTSYSNLTLSGGAETFGAITTIGGNLTLSGSATATTGAALTIGGNLNVGDGTTFTAAAFALTETGTTTIGGGSSGNLTISSATGAKLFTGGVSVAAGGTWNNSANSPVEFRGGITNNTTGIFTAGSGVQSFTTNAQALNGPLSISSVTVTSPSVLTNNGTLTVGTALAGSGNLTNAASGTLNLNFTLAPSITALNASANNNTVSYGYAGAQTIFGTTYSNLTLAGSGVKSFQAGPTTIGGNLSIGSGVSAQLYTGTNTPVNTLILNLIAQNSGTWGSTSSSATNKNSTYFGTTSSGIINVSTSSCTPGTWLGTTSTDWKDPSNWCGGVPTSSTNVIINAGGNQPSLLTAGGVCNNITINSGATLTVGGAYNLIVNGNWALNTGGTFTPGTGTVTFNGTSQTIGGTTTINAFNNLSTSGSASVTPGTAITIAGNLSIGDGTTFTTAPYALTVTGTTTIGGGTSGTLTLSSGSGTLTFNGNIAVNAGGTWNNTAANLPLTFPGSISCLGTFNAGTGVYTLSGTTQTISGILSIPSVTVTGTYTNNGSLTVGTALSGTGRLTQGASTSAILNLGGTVTITTLAATNTGNTVNFTGASQTVNPLNYYNLILSGSGTDVLQTATTAIGGNLTVSGSVTTTQVANLAITGNLTIGSGATFATAAALTLSAATIQVDGSFNIGSTGTLSATNLTVNGTVTNSSTGTLTVTNLIVNGTWNHNTTSSLLPQGSTLANTTWAASSNLNITASFTTATVFTNFIGQSFGNFTYNCPGQTNTVAFVNAAGTTTIKGNFTVASTGTSAMYFRIGNQPYPATVNINGNFNISGGNFDMHDGGTYPTTITINLDGNFSMSAGTLSQTTTQAGSPVLFNFVGSGIQTVNITGGTITSQATTPSCALQFIVANGSTIDMGTSVLTGTNNTSFTLSDGAGIITANTGGLSSSGATGSIQVSGPRTYSPIAEYTYNSLVAGQVTGNGVTAADDMTFSNTTSSGVTFSNSIAVSGTMAITHFAHVNLGTYLSSANVLILDGSTQTLGTSYGGTTSTATNILPTYFNTATGILNVSLAPPSNLSYNSPFSFPVSVLITEQDPTVTGIVTAFSVSPTLPTGLSFNTSTGAITGTPTVSIGSATYTVTASNSAGSTSFGVVISVGQYRYAVNSASAAWNLTSTWSSTSGGGSGASIPVSGDQVFIGEASTNRIVTIPSGYAAACGSLTMGNSSAATTATLTISGSLLVDNNLVMNRPFTTATTSISVGSSSMTVGGTLQLANSPGSYVDNTLINSVTISTGTVSVGNLYFGGQAAGQSQIVFTGAGTLNISGSATTQALLGTLTPSTGTVNFNGSGAQTIPFLSAITYNNLTLSGGNTKSLSANTTVPGILTVNAGVTLANSGFTLSSPSAVNVYCGAPAGSSITGSGLMTLGGNITVTNAGTGNNGATISCPVALGAARTFTVANDGTSATDLTVSGIISGSYGFVKAGAGTMVLSGANLFTGGTSLTAGTLKLGASSTVSSAGPLGTTTGTTTVSSGAVLDLNGFSLTGGATNAIQLNGPGLTGAAAGALTNTGTAPATIIGAITLGSASTITAAGSAGTLTCSGTVGTGAYALTLDGISGSSGTMSGILSTPTSITKTGQGFWTLSGANSYTGATNINAGTLMLGNVSALGTSTGITTVTSGATLDLNGITLSSADPLTLNGTGVSGLGALLNSSGTAAGYSGAITLGSATSIGTTGNITLGSAGITGGQDLTKIGSATLNLGSGTVTLGALNINAGTLTSTTGTMSLTGNFTNSGTFMHNGGLVTFNGTGTQLINSGGSAFNNFTITNTGGTCSSAADLTSAGTFTTNTGSTLNMGTNVLNVTTVAHSGSLYTQNISTTPITSLKTWGGTVTFNGVAAQTIPASTFNNLTLNNSTGATLSGAVTVGGTLGLTSGILTTTGSNLLSISNTANSAITTPSATSYINGPLKWSLVNGFSYVFPVGASSTYYPFALNSVSGTSPVMTAQVFSGSTVGSAGTGLCAISSSEYWQLTNNSGTFTNGNVSLTPVTPLSGFDAIGISTSLTGSYSNINGTLATPSITSSDNIGSIASGSDYFVMAKKAPTISLTSATGTTAQTACLNTAITNITYSVGGSATGATVSGLPTGVNGLFSGGIFTISGTPSVSAGSPYNYTITTTGGSCTGATATGTITVNALPQGSLTANGPLCVSGAGQLTWSSSAGTGPFTVVYNDGAANRTATGVVSGTSFATFTTPVTSTTTYTLVSVTDANGCIRTTGFTGSAATITVNALPVVTFTAQPGSSTCIGVGVTYSTQAGMASYVWGFPGVLNTDYSITSGGTGTSNTVTLQYLTAGSKTVTINYTNGNGCTAVAATSSTATTVHSLPQGSLTANGPFCVSGAGQLTWTSSAGTGPFTVIYNDGAANRTASGVVSGTSFATYTTPVTSTTTYTLVSVTDANGCIRTTGFTGSAATITVNALPVVTFTAQPGSSACIGVGVTYSTQAGMTSYVWGFPGVLNTDYSITSGGTGGSNTITLQYLTAGSKTVTINYTNGNGCTAVAATSSTATTVNPLPQGSLTANGPFCVSGAGQLTWSSSAGTGPFTVIYNDGAANRTASGVVSGTSFATFTTPVTSTTTYTLVSVTDANGCIRTTGFTGSSASISINPVTTISNQSTGGQTQCAGGTFNPITVTATGAGTLSYQWYSNPSAVTSGGTNLGSSNGAQTYSYTPQSTSAGTLYYYCVATGTCGTVTTATSTISGAFLVNPAAIGGTVTGGASEICLGGSTGTLTLSGYTGTIVEWDRQLNSGGWQSNGNGGSTTYSEVPYGAGTWQYRALIQNGPCQAYSSVVTVVVDPTTTVGWLSGGTTPICQGASLGVMTLGASTGSIIRWEKRVNSGTWTNILNNSNTYSEIPTSAGTWDYRVLVQSGTCSSLYSNVFTVVVNPTLTITLGPNPVVCLHTTTAYLNYTATTGSPSLYSITFDAAAVSAGMGSFSNYGLNASPIPINVPWGITPGVYNAILSVGTSTPVCSSINYPITVTVQDNTVAVAITGSTTPCQGTSQTYTATSLSGATYNWTFPSGWVQTGGGTTNSVTVTVGSASGNVQVTPIFTCGSGTSQSLAVTTTLLPTTATISTTPLSYCGILVSGSLGGNSPVSGTGAWSIVSGGTGTFSSPASGSSTFTANAYGNYVLRWTISNGSCTASTADVTVNYYATPTTATVGATQNLCGTLVSAGLGGNTPTNGTGTWSIVSGGTGTFSSSASGSSTFTANAYGPYVLAWTISNGTCTASTANVTVNYYATPTTATVGSIQNLCGTLISTALGGNSPTNGTGAWSIVSGGTGTFSASGTGSSTFTANAYGAYVLRWTISNGTCTASTADVTVNYYATPTTATVGAAQNLCGTLVSNALGGNTPAIGTGAWSIVSGGTGTFSSPTLGGSTFTATGYGSYVLRWTISNGNCTSSTADVTVNYFATPTTATVGSTQNLCETLISTALGGNSPTSGTGAWSIVSGGTGSFSSSGSGSSTFTASTYGSYVLRWTISNGTCTSSTADVTVNYYAAPTTATVGSTQNLCGILVSNALGGNTPTIGTGAWSIVSGGAGTFSSPTTGASTFTATGYGSYVLRWTISNGNCTSSTADVIVNYYATPTTATVGPNQNLCGILVSAGLGGNTPGVGSGAWSVVSGGSGSFSSSNSGSSTFTASTYGTHVLRWTISNGSCTASTADVTVNYYATPTTASVGSNQNLCGTLVSLALGGNTAVNGSGAWSILSGGTGTFSSSNTGSSTFTANNYGSYVLRWTISNGTCTASTADVTVNYYAPLTVGISGGTSPICYNTAPGTFTATGSGGTGAYTYQWYNSSGSISGATSSTYAPGNITSTTGYYCAITSGPCGTVNTSTTTIIVDANLTAVISGGTSPICYNTSPGTFTATGDGGTGSYTYQWYSTTTGIITGATSSTYAPGNITTTTGYYCAVTSGSCGTVNTSTTNITVYGNLTAGISGGTSPICYNTDPGTFTATGSGGNGTYTYQWYNSSGMITGATSSTYDPGNITATTGYYCAVTSGSCGTVNTSTTNITVYGNLTAGISGGNSPICYNTDPGTFTATGSGGNNSYSYQWYNSSGIISGATSSTYNPGNITTSTDFYCAITSGSCGTVNTSRSTITVYGNLTAGISGGTSPICYNTSPGTFTATGSGGNTTYTYQWYNSSGMITGATSSTYNPGNITTTTGYYCAVTSGSCGTVNTSTTNITVYGNLTAGISGGTSPICYNTDPGTFTATGSGGNNSYSYQWYNSSGIISGATSSTYNPGNITASTDFYCAITSGSCGTVNTSRSTITVYGDLTAGISGGTSPICYNTAPGTLIATGGGGNGSYTYQWYSTTGIITGATNSTYTSGSLTSTTGYYCAVTSGSCGTVNTPTTTIVVYPDLTAGISGGTSPICYNTDPGTFTATGSGGSGSYSYLWYMNGLSTGVVTQTFTPGNLTSTSGIYCAITSASCSIVNTSTTTITVTPLPTATISYSGAPFCTSVTTAQPVTLSGTAAYTGGTFSSTTGLSLDAGSGAIIPSTCTPGSYMVTYTVPASGGCGTVTTTTPVVINLDGSWTGSVNTDWNTPGNWTCNQLPSITSDVLISTGLTHYPTISSGSTATCRNLSIQNGATLTVTGNILQIAGIITNSGTFTSSAGTIQMEGSAAQTIGAGTFAANTVMNLTVSNSSGVTLAGPLSVTGIVKAATGDLTSGGNLVLISSAGQTALVDGSGSGNVVGNVTMQRYLPSAFGYKYISSPFQSATVNGLSSYVDLGATFPSFYKYDENNHHDSTTVSGIVPAYQSGWVNYTAATNPLVPQMGYAANFGTTGTPEIYNLSGVVNNGSLSVSLMNNNRKYTQGFNLVGNPYPSPIDWNAAIGWTKTKIDNAIYFFNADASDQYSGVYSSYVNGTGTGNGTNLIASMQGFFIHVSDGSYPITGTLGMTNSVRTNDLAPTFRDATLDSRTILRFTATLETSTPTEDVALLYFDNQASRSFNKELDALKLTNTAIHVPNLYTLSTDPKQLSIYAIPQPTDSTTRIPVGITTLSDGWVDFKARDISSLPAGLYIYLVDNLHGITQDLKKNPDYRFNLKAGTYNQRFTLVFSLTELNPIAPVAEKMFILKRSASQYTATINLPGTSGGSLYVTNMLGQIILLREVFDQQTVEINPGSSSGLYIVTVISGNRKQSEKILMQ